MYPVLHNVALSGYADKQSKSSRRDVAKVWVHVDMVGETILDNLVNRRSRPTKMYEAIVRVELAKHGVYPDQIRWRQKLGCSCGCSPGFLVVVEDREARNVLNRAAMGTNKHHRDEDLAGGYWPLTLHITVEFEKGD